MKELVDGKVYNTDTAVLVKFKSEVEDLTNGYTRFISRGLYYRGKKDDWFIYNKKVSVDSRLQVIDVIEYITPATDDIARDFRSYVEYS